MISWEIFTNKENKLRYTLHMEYLNQCLDKKIIQKGLNSHLTTCMQEGSSVNTWKM